MLNALWETQQVQQLRLPRSLLYLGQIIQGSRGFPNEVGDRGQVEGKRKRGEKGAQSCLASQVMLGSAVSYSAILASSLGNVYLPSFHPRKEDPVRLLSTDHAKPKACHLKFATV